MGTTGVKTFAPANAEFGVDPTVHAFWVPAELHRQSWAEIVSALGGEDGIRRMFRDKAFSFGKAVHQVDCNEVVFDERHARITAKFASEFGGLRWTGVLVSFVGRDGVAEIACHAMEKDFAKSKPQFDALVDSFRFDEGYGRGDLHPFWIALGKAIAVAVGLGVLVAVALWIARAREGKKASAKARERLARSRPATVRP